MLISPPPVLLRWVGRLGAGAAAGASGVRGGGRAGHQRRPVGPGDRDDAGGWQQLDLFCVHASPVQWGGPGWMNRDSCCTGGCASTPSTTPTGNCCECSAVPDKGVDPTAVCHPGSKLRCVSKVILLCSFLNYFCPLSPILAGGSH